ncbi:hypothetical protein HID58_061398, partial [Brassica napus]
ANIKATTLLWMMSTSRSNYNGGSEIFRSCRFVFDTSPPIRFSLSLFFHRGGATFRFWKAINMKCRGELMGVDMLLLHAKVILMPATVNSYRVIKYHFSGPFILVTSDMVEEVYVTAEGIVPESEIIKPPKAGAEEAIEMWTEVALASGDMYAEPSARKSGHRFANKRTVER